MSQRQGNREVPDRWEEHATVKMQMDARHIRLTRKPAGSIVAVSLGALLLAGCASTPPAETPAAAAEQPPQAGLPVSDYSVSMTLAEAAERSGDLVSASTYYAQAIAEGKGGPRPFIRRGEILLTLGQPAVAAHIFEMGLARGYDELALHRGYGRALAWLGQADAALPEYDIALSKDPMNIETMNGRGVVLDMLGRHDEAQAQYLEAMGRAPGNLSVQNNLALSYALSGKLEQGIAVLENIEMSGVSSAQHRQNLALLYGLAGKGDAAERMARRDLGRDQADENLELYKSMRHLFLGTEGDVPEYPPATDTGQATPLIPAPPASKASETAKDKADAPVAPPPVPTPDQRAATVTPPVGAEQSTAEAGNLPIEGAEPAPAPAQPAAQDSDQVVPIVTETADDVSVEIPLAVDAPTGTQAGDGEQVPLAIEGADEPVEVTVEAAPATGDTASVEVPLVQGANEAVIPIAVDNAADSDVVIAVERQGEGDQEIDVLPEADVPDQDAGAVDDGIPPGVVVHPSDGPLRSESAGQGHEMEVARANAVTERVPPQGGDWVVEIGPFESQGAAETMWVTMQSNSKSLVAGLGHVIQASSSGTRLRVGPIADFDSARELCGEFADVTPPCAVHPY